MADNTFYITQPLVFGNIKLKAVGRGRERAGEREGRKCSGAKVFAILFEVPIQQGKLNFRQCLIVFCVNA